MSIERGVNSSGLRSQLRGVRTLQSSISDQFDVWTGAPEHLRLVRFHPEGLDPDVQELCPSPEIQRTASARAPLDRCPSASGVVARAVLEVRL